MLFPDGSGKRVDMMYPADNTYWTKLKAFVDYEPFGDRSRAARNARRDRHREGPTLPADRKAAGIAEKGGRDRAEDDPGARQFGRPDERNLYYKDRQSQNTWAGATSDCSRTAISM